MPKIIESKIMPCDADHLYQIVLDIENYPKFLPWCQNARINKIISENKIHAELLINFKNIFEKYTSEVTFDRTSPNEYFVNAKAINGPFKSLVNNWKITQIANKKSQVDFYLEFEFNSLILTKMLGGIFTLATEKMINAFENRALELYK